ncbi:MAG: hypothetical protein ACREL1_02425, partial [bacterium]
MKSNSKKTAVWRTYALGAGFVLLGGCSVFFGWGCENSAPGFGAYSAPSSVPNVNRVDQFAMGVSAINPNLFENNNPPTFKLKTPGAVTVVNNFATYGATTGGGIVPDGAVSPYCFQMSGAVTDRLDGTFPALDLEVPLENYTYFDANHFTGVKFYLKVANDDTAFHRVFSIPVAQTVPTGTNNGTCPAGPKQCYDHFAADYSGGTGGQWLLTSYNFSDLQQLQSGYAPV